MKRQKIRVKCIVIKVEISERAAIKSETLQKRIFQAVILYAVKNPSCFHVLYTYGCFSSLYLTNELF